MGLSRVAPCCLDGLLGRWESACLEGRVAPGAEEGAWETWVCMGRALLCRPKGTWGAIPVPAWACLWSKVGN